MTPSSAGLRAVLAAAVVATTLSFPVAARAAAPLPAPVVTPNPVTVGSVATVTGTGCPATDSQRAEVRLVDSTNEVVAYADANPAADGIWTAHLTPPLTGAAGRYTVEATCGSATYTGRAISVMASSAAPWTPQQPDLPLVPNGSLDDVACVTATMCAAVGGRSVDGNTAALVETWDGTRWTVARPFASHGELDSDLRSVSCPSATRCVAVGLSQSFAGIATLVAILDGTTWTARLLPAPRGTLLLGISCPNARTCIAVGQSGSAPVAYRLTGTTWSETAPPPSPAPSASFSGVDCPSQTGCVAVGTIDSGFPVIGFAQQFDGTSWTEMSLPTPPSTRVVLNDVDCVTTVTCSAVGSAGGTGPFDAQLPLVESLSGTRWTRTPVSADTSDGRLDSVSCTSGTTCTAVGVAGSDTTSDAGRPIVARKDRTRWVSTAVTVPGVPPPAAFAGLSCTGTAWCLAVGAHTGVPLAASSSGAAWSDEHATAPLGTVGGRFEDVACSGISACTAVGATGRPDQASAPLVNRWNGSRWTLQRLPDVGDAELTSVACPGPTVCVAAGDAHPDGPSSFRPVVLLWRAGVWREVPVDHSPADGARVMDVACSSPTSCLVVGQLNTFDGGPLAIALTGTRATMTGPPPVRGLRGVSLNGVSCATATNCRVVGYGYDDSFSYVGVDLIWNGATFTTGPALPDSGPVGCAHAASCVATTAGRTGESLSASVILGRDVMREWLPDSGGAAAAGLDCRPSLARVAAGASQDGAYVARRTGGAWTQEPVDAPVASYVALAGVACPSDTSCVAVGQAGVPLIVVSPS